MFWSYWAPGSFSDSQCNANVFFKMGGRRYSFLHWKDCWSIRGLGILGWFCLFFQITLDWVNLGVWFSSSDWIFWCLERRLRALPHWAAACPALCRQALAGARSSAHFSHHSVRPCSWDGSRFGVIIVVSHTEVFMTSARRKRQGVVSLSKREVERMWLISRSL